MDCCWGFFTPDRFQPLPPEWRQGLRFRLCRGIAPGADYSYSDQLGSEVRAVQLSVPLMV